MPMTEATAHGCPGTLVVLAILLGLACAPALMKQENRVLEVIGDARRFGLGETGELLLRAGPERSLTAFPAG